LTLGAELDEMADPASTTYNPRPEWYFLFLFQMLKLFPGKLEALAAVGVPLVGVMALLLVPRLDRTISRHPWDRPRWTALGMATLSAVVVLTWYGAQTPMINRAIRTDPKITEGQLLFATFGCGNCHSVFGEGGTVGPNLSDVGLRRDAKWLEEHFKEPREVSPGTVMPKIDMLVEERESLVAYMKSLPDEGRCMSCHSLGGVGR